MGFSPGAGTSSGGPSQPVWGTSNSSSTGGISLGGGVIGAVASVAATAYSYYRQQEAQEDAEKFQKLAYRDQREARSQQEAMNASRSARDTRSQIREERIRRARIIQASVNTGVSGSSGEIGSTGGLATQLGSNLGFMNGQQAGAQRISGLGQNAADFLSASQNKINDANQWGQIGGLGLSIFGATGGFNQLGNIFKSNGDRAADPK